MPDPVVVPERVAEMFDGAERWSSGVAAYLEDTGLEDTGCLPEQA